MTQDEAFHRMLGPDNCFLTGEAGTGKSFLIKRLMEALGRNPALAVTATTGIAARNIHGQTLHSFLGIGLGRRRDKASGRLEDFEKFWQKCLYSPYFNRTGISSTEYLIIDEISMMNGTFLQDTQRILKRVKGSNEPFGGIKVIFVGDFLQLPPVQPGTVYDWAFKSDAWRGGSVRMLNLTKSYRQTDAMWANALNDIRVARISAHTEALLAERAVEDIPDDFDGTVLMTHNKQVFEYNTEKLTELPGDIKTFRGVTTGKPEKIEQFLETITTPENLQLKKGARVIMTVNDRDGCYYNGSLGTILGWDGPQEIVYVGLDDGIEIAAKRFLFSNEHQNVSDTSGKPSVTMRQYPMKLGWGMSIHASQGMTLSKVYVNAEHIFVAHQLYVALSRCKTLEGLSIRGFEKRLCYVDYEARKFYEDARQTITV